MKIITLSMIKYSQIPLEFDNVLPELLYDKTLKEIGDVIVYRGNSQCALSEYFDVAVEGECNCASDCKIIMNGNLERVKYIGLNMSEGMIEVNSGVDLHLGAQMSGGHIIVNGDAESYVGREMKGGLIEVNGSTKEFCGASYMGEWRGMSGGKIIINGDVGEQLAECMSSGEIYVKGNCGKLLAIHMMGGYVQIDGDVDRWPARKIKKGTVVINGSVGEILEGFTKKETVANPLINGKYHIGSYTLYVGDVTVRGKAQLWIKN